MSDPILADQIRAFTFSTFVEPYLAEGGEIPIRAGDVHKAMGFSARVPLVVASLRARYFAEQYGLTFVRRDGAVVGASTTLVFRAENASAPPFEPGGAVWAEVTSLEHGHGGPGWELGRWLWSPTTSIDGAERYAVMEQPRYGDQVFHMVAGTVPGNPRQRVLFGMSRVAAPAERSDAKPASPGAWGEAKAYFRIRLEGFVQFVIKVPMEKIETELADIISTDLVERPKYYPYSPYRDGFRGSQGIYLTKLTNTLAEALRELAIVDLQPSSSGSSDAPTATMRAFAEGERARRESAFFKRNPALRAAAIAKHGFRCAGCEKTMGELYGALGEGYIEIHHLDPLGERADMLGRRSSETSVDDVAPLCPNCHRIVHRSRPALSLSDLRIAISAARPPGQN